MHILNGKLIHGDINVNAKGGTELIAENLVRKIPYELLKEFQIVVSRIQHPLDESKLRIYYCHDLPGDPASEHLKNGGWNKFHKLVFVSNWQMQAYCQHYDIPMSKCIVMLNAMEPIPEHTKPDTSPLRLAYWSTPHRGLDILVPVFEKLCEQHGNIELDVYSSFKLYGWGERDRPYEELFERCRKHPKINYHGTVTNQVLRKNLEQTHILAYPSTWTETSCITLMEAMSAGLLCVHSNLGALYETAANWTAMYQYHENKNVHANLFYQVLNAAILNYDSLKTQLPAQQSYANVFYTWTMREYQWTALLTSLIDEPRELPLDPENFFQYKT